jgi:hypothetical protein
MEEMEMLGFVSVAYEDIIELEERTMQTLSVEALCAEWLIEEETGMMPWEEEENA